MNDTSASAGYGAFLLLSPVLIMLYSRKYRAAVAGRFTSTFEELDDIVGIVVTCDHSSSLDIPDLFCEEHLSANDLHEKCLELNKK